MEKKKIQHQYGVSRCSYGVCKIRLRFHYDSCRQRYDSSLWSYECSRMLTMWAQIRYSATAVQAGSATAASRSPTNVHDLAVVMRQVNRGVSDTPIHPERSRMATIPPTVPPRLSPIPLPCGTIIVHSNCRHESIFYR